MRKMRPSNVRVMSKQPSPRLKLGSRKGMITSVSGANLPLEYAMRVMGSLPRGWMRGYGEYALARGTGSSAGAVRRRFPYGRFRPFQPELHIHLAVHRRRPSEVFPRVVPLAGSPV